VKTRDEIFLPIIGSRNLDIALGEACVTQTFGHGFRGGRHVANGIGGVDLNELLEDVVRQLLRLIRTLRSS
jgi:hypothetical protein